MNTAKPQDGELLDTYLTEREYDAQPNERAAIKLARKRHRERMRQQGPTGRIRSLTHGAAGESVLLAGYTRTSQVSPLVADVGLAEGAQFACKLERSLVDGLPVGVRVTLVGLTR